MERNYSQKKDAVTQRRLRYKKKSEGYKYCAFWIHESIYVKIRRMINMLVKRSESEIAVLSDAVEMLEGDDDMVVKIVKNHHGLGVVKEKYCGWLIKN